MADVFLSFSHQDRDAAMTLRNLLRQQGLSVFSHFLTYSHVTDIGYALFRDLRRCRFSVGSIREQPFIDEMSSLGVPC